MRSLILLASLALSSAAWAQTGMDALSDRLNSVRPGAVTATDCARQVSQAPELNGPDLLYGAAVCFAASQRVEGSFLLVAGQVRSSVDMALTVPASRADSEAQAALYGVIFFQAGGPGDEEVLRDAAMRERFLAMFDGWSPRFAADYNPGWNLRRRPDAADYNAAILEAKADRRRQLGDVAPLYSDAQYYALHRRHRELQARNPRGFVEGTADATLSTDLLRQMNARMAALGIGPPIAIDQNVSDVRMPPETPGADEVAVSGSSDPVARRCADSAERYTIAEESRIIRVLVTRSPQWGIVWRADIGGGDRPMMRFTCSATSTSYRPADLGEGGIAPLPER